MEIEAVDEDRYLQSVINQLGGTIKGSIHLLNIPVFIAETIADRYYIRAGFHNDLIRQEFNAK